MVITTDLMVARFTLTVDQGWLTQDGDITVEKGLEILEEELRTMGTVFLFRQDHTGPRIEFIELEAADGR